MAVSYSKLLARYQSRNGRWFAVNRKHKVKRKKVNDGLDGGGRGGGGDSACERGGDAGRLA